jgi:hypothetical protein
MVFWLSVDNGLVCRSLGERGECAGGDCDRAIGVGRASVFAITAMGGPSSSVFTDETDTSSALDALLKSGFDGESLRMLALRGNEPKVLPLLCVQGAWRRA